MERKLLMGNEAIAYGAIRAGVTFASGYPGTPSSEILETLAKVNPVDMYIEWSVNEKSALETASGAAIAGARTLVTMKQVGLNVASDPLMSLNYVGIKGGMVIVVADDPGPISSQTEQDTRHFGKFAKIVVFDPSSPEEAYNMIGDAFEISERIGRPVLFRPTTRVCHSYESVALSEPIPVNQPEGFCKDDGKWVIFPRLAYLNHLKIEDELKNLSSVFSVYKRNILSGNGRKGIVSGGVSWCYVQEVLEGITSEYKRLKISTVPFPEELGLDFLKGLDEVLVVEELDPVIEEALILLCGKHGLKVTIKGKISGDMIHAGENTIPAISTAIHSFLEENEPPEASSIPASIPELPLRPPVLCAGCPHRASFFAVKEAVKGQKAVFSGDIGCYTLGNAMPLDMVDTCLCMGAGITMAQGINRIEPETLNFAFIGDSTFFHTGIPGIINGVFNRSDIIIAILDNSTTAMTGGQTHPGIGKTVRGEAVPKINIYDVVRGIGVSDIQQVNAFDFQAAKEAVSRAADKKGVRVIIFQGECIALSKKRKACVVDDKLCTGCGICIKKLGCPALQLKEKKAKIDPVLCTGCMLCQNVCSFQAINKTE